MRVDFAFDENFGYLTTSLINVGTGLRFSCLLNLYGIVASKAIESLIDAVGKIGYSISGVSGSSDCGFFYIYNIYSLGLSEDEMVDEFEKLLLKIMKLENDSRNEFFGKRDQLEISFEELYETSSYTNISYDNMLYYLSLLDALNKRFIMIKDISSLRKLVYRGTDDYLMYRSFADKNSLETIRMNLLKKYSSQFRYKKSLSLYYPENI